MHVLYYILVLLYFSSVNAQFKNNHDYLMEQFKSTSVQNNLSAIVTKWFTQPTDHFNQGDDRKWRMRYFQNMEKWRPGGPVYIYIGGEGKLYPDVLSSGLLFDLASETNGAMFGVEHRYYGESKPFPDVTRSNLKYLSSKQALADLANIVKNIKLSSPLKEAKVVVVGGSYAGNLAAWMRLVYPDLVDAAISSSAPVLAKLDFFEYIDTVGDDFKKYATPECFNNITTKFNQYREAFKTQAATEQLKNTYGICNASNLMKRENQGLFLGFWVTSVYFVAAQYGNPQIIKQTCDESLKSVQEDYNSVCIDLEFNNIYNNKSLIFKNFVWPYQTCNEFGYFNIPTNIPPFGDVYTDTSFWVEICSNLYGQEFNRANIEANIKRTNDKYGGLKPNLTNVIFVHGEIDPWHRLGITQDLSESAPARVIPEASHCTDLLSAKTPEVQKVQQEEKRFIKKWIGLE